MPPLEEAAATAVRAIHATPAQGVIAVTGGGSGAMGWLVGQPGASRTLLEAVVPYSQASLASWVGAPVESACSERTARVIAMAAFVKARRLAPETNKPLFGVGCTASLATDRPKRGDHRLHVAVQTESFTSVWSLTLVKGARSRSEEERLAAAAVIDAVATACGADHRLTDALLADSEEPTLRRADAPAEWRGLLLGESLSAPRMKEPPKLLLPGSFNPLHAGHRGMAAAAEKILGERAVFELSLTNAEKPPLDYLEIEQRAGQFGEGELLLTNAATFEEKSRIAPGCVFAVGADTISRIGDARFYGGSETQRDAALRRIADAGCRFLVFGRAEGGRFVSLEDLSLPKSLSGSCQGVPETAFRNDLSSTKLRG